MADEGEVEGASGGPTGFRGWPAVGCVILLVLFAGIVAVEFVPIERLHGWPLYIATALLVIGVSFEVLFLGIEVIGWIADTGGGSCASAEANGAGEGGVPSTRPQPGQGAEE